LGKFVPQLVEIFLRKFQPKVVCDPFCGSGTSLVEAVALGVDSIGCDISEFNCLLTKVKTDNYDLDLLDREVKDIASKTIGVELGILLERKQSYVSGEYLSQWYAPEALETLLLYRSLIPIYTYQDVLKVILSRAARSARLTTHFDLDFPRVPQRERYYCYKHSRTCHPTKDAAQFIRRYSYDTLRRIREFAAIRKDAKVTIVSGDARTIEFPKFDMVITSPPYVGLIDYHEQHRYAYELLGLQWKAQGEVGAAFNGNSARAQRKYVEDITKGFENLKKFLAPNGRIIVVANDKHNLYDKIAQQIGVRVETVLHRQVNRRTGRRADDFFESVFVWRA